MAIVFSYLIYAEHPVVSLDEAPDVPTQNIRVVPLEEPVESPEPPGESNGHRRDEPSLVNTSLQEDGITHTEEFIITFARCYYGRFFADRTCQPGCSRSSNTSESQGTPVPSYSSSSNANGLERRMPKGSVLKV